jgi:hypothetical protein
VSWVSMPRFIFLRGVNVVGLFVLCLNSHRAKSRLNMDMGWDTCVLYSPLRGLLSFSFRKSGLRRQFTTLESVLD